MYLPSVIPNLRALLSDFSLKTVNRYPNIYGVYEQSEIVLDISEGNDVGGDSINEELINLTLRVSIVTGKGSNDKTEYSEGDRDLETMISLIINVLRKKVIPGSKRIRFVSFQKFTPESGKHRAIVTFTIPIYITNFTEESLDGRVKEIQLRYS